ncbi:DUF4123 domain-containing protein [Litchfieldella rifensis]|uniref:DUF4123 domain-containing protein n=1 Tax=Litchfieldella rifensis TaxID=762643 RepID=A0ABV7LNB9_9GAMM
MVELASLSPATRSALFSTFETSNCYWPLIDDGAQPHLMREGPWVLEVNDSRLEAWQHFEKISCALYAWIESELDGELLAAQLAPAMIVESLEGKRSLLRFYVPEVIERLHADAPDEYRSALFAGIRHWWYRSGKYGWTALEGVAHKETPRPWKLKVNDDLWVALNGNTEVMRLTAELVENAPDLFTGVCSCERPRLVAKTLEDADRHGLTRASDRRTYAYLLLSQGEDTWQSKEMRPLLQQAANGKAPLLELLTEKHGEMF